MDQVSWNPTANVAASNSVEMNAYYSPVGFTGYAHTLPLPLGYHSMGYGDYSMGYAQPGSQHQNAYDYRVACDVTDSSDVTQWSLSTIYGSPSLGYSGHVTQSLIESAQTPARHQTPVVNTPQAGRPLLKGHLGNDSSTPNVNTGKVSTKELIERYLPLSPISSTDLTAELAPFEFIGICDSSAVTSTVDVTGDFLDVDNDLVPSIKDVSDMFDDIHGSINASDLNMAQPPEAAPSINTTVWDSADITPTSPKEKTTVVCQYCSATFKSYVALFKHEKICDKHAANYCAICDKDFASTRSYKTHKQRQHSVVNECTVCRLVFATARELTNHMATHRPSSRIIHCYKCGESFVTRYRLTKHMKQARCTANYHKTQ